MPACSQFDRSVVSVHRAKARVSSVSVPPSTPLANDTADAECGNGEQNKHGDAKHSKGRRHLHDRTLEVTLVFLLLRACERLFALIGQVIKLLLTLDILLDGAGQTAHITLKPVNLVVKFGLLRVLVILELRHDCIDLFALFFFDFLNYGRHRLLKVDVIESRVDENEVSLIVKFHLFADFIVGQVELRYPSEDLGK